MKKLISLLFAIILLITLSNCNKINFETTKCKTTKNELKQEDYYQNYYVYGVDNYYNEISNVIVYNVILTRENESHSVRLNEKCYVYFKNHLNDSIPAHFNFLGKGFF